MGGASLPPGFRFHPTDEELVGYYLRRKVEGLDFELDVIPVIDLYKFDPWELPEKSFLPNRDMQWFFFCPRDRKYLNGSRTKRATKAGYWKATGKDRKVVCGSSIWAHRKTLVFYQGQAPLGNRTNWFMHEYRLCDDDSCQETHNSLGAFALCRVIKKNGNKRKISGSAVDSLNGKSVMSNYTGNTLMEISNEPPRAFSNISSQDSGHSSPMTSPYSPVPDFGLGPVLESNPEKFSVTSDLILDSSKEHTQVQEMPPEIFRQCGILSSMSSWRPYVHQEISPCSFFSNFAGELSDDLMQFGYSNGSHNRLNESEGIAYNSYDLTSSLRDSELS